MLRLALLIITQSCTSGLLDLPQEIILAIIDSQLFTQRELARLCTVHRVFTGPATSLLFQAPQLTSLRQLDRFLYACEPRYRRDSHHRDHDLNLQDGLDWTQMVRTLRISCTQFGERGWGQRIGRILQLCTNLERLFIWGVDDLRMKYFTGQGGESRELEVRLNGRLHADMRPTTPLPHAQPCLNCP